MASVFRFHIFHASPSYARQAAQAAFALVDELEQELSYFVPASDVSQINRLRAGESVRVGEATLRCIQVGQAVHELTDGAFDLTVGALIEGREPWDRDAMLPGGQAWQPRTGPVTVGMQAVAVNAPLRAVALLTEGVQIDLGGIGKGYALDAAAELLADWQITRAMLSAGQSTMLAIGDGPAGPGSEATAHRCWPMRAIDPDTGQVLAHFRTSAGRAVSMSSRTPSGKAHILSPATGEPVLHHRAAWAMADSATWADALSTAFLVMNDRSVATLCRRGGRQEKPAAGRPEAQTSARDNWAGSQGQSISGMLLIGREGHLSLDAWGPWDRLCCELSDRADKC